MKGDGGGELDHVKGDGGGRLVVKTMKQPKKLYHIAITFFLTLCK